MKRLASQLSSQLALALAALAATPAALAGSEIMKCVDASGHVTLTDQPCASGERATRLLVVAAAEPASASGPESAAGQPSAAQRYDASPAMLRQQDWRPRMANRDRPLARDVATLKAARAQLMLIDADRHPRPQLATIQ
ncbi:DUF4124 domain-containing protein [Massilia sp. GCM10023247]|uniref:DUF4124 domain-containing protein n=1 Tax=Massilia sp. GCM10023247 TaxID=3252643 RepID=UPI003613AC95